MSSSRHFSSPFCAVFAFVSARRFRTTRYALEGMRCCLAGSVPFFCVFLVNLGELLGLSATLLARLNRRGDPRLVRGDLCPELYGDELVSVWRSFSHCLVHMVEYWYLDMFCL